MPTIHGFDNFALKVCMYADDHAPPHVHVIRDDVECLVRLADFEVIEGEVDRRDHARAVDWLRANLLAVQAKWRELNERD